MKSVVIYCRVSTGDQDCERQVRDLTAFAERAGYKVLDVYKETASGSKNDRKERRKVLALAQARKIDAILVTELTRWGRSTLDLLETLQQLQSWNVSVIAQSGMQFDLSTAQGKLIATLMSGLAEFEKELLTERVKSGLEAAKARGKKLGRPKGNRTVDKHRKAVLSCLSEGMSYRRIADKLGISKDTIGQIAREVKS